MTVQSFWRSRWVRLGSLATLALLLGWGSFSPVAFAKKSESKKTEQLDQFTPNPLEKLQPDPLLPAGASTRPLTAAEQQTLRTALDELQVQALAQFQAGNRTGAFELWYRELRLRRLLGSTEEVAALNRVGQIAWNNNRSTDVRYITERLQVLQTQAKAQTPPNVELLRSLGQAYQGVRAKALAVDVYQQLLASAQQAQDAIATAKTLDTLGKLHLNWFDFQSAAATYQELLNLVKTQNQLATGQFSEASLLQQLAYIHEQGKQPEQAIAIQQQLLDRYQAQDPTQVPKLKIAIGKNQQKLGQREQAIQNYQTAYLLAQKIQQFAHASEALEQLGALYRSDNQLDDALKIYQFLVDVEKQSYDVYGQMSAYDVIGQIHVARQDYPQAIAAFQQGLALAQQLKWQEAYFAQQLQQAQQPSQTATPTANPNP